MSHDTPDTCAFEYTDAFRAASRLAPNELRKNRERLVRRIGQLEVFGQEVPEYLRAALRGYDDYVRFQFPLQVRS